MVAVATKTKQKRPKHQTEKVSLSNTIKLLKFSFSLPDEQKRPLLRRLL